MGWAGNNDAWNTERGSDMHWPGVVANKQRARIYYLRQARNAFRFEQRDAIRRIKEREFGRANQNYAISRSKPGGEIKEAPQRPALVFAACARVNENRFTVGLRFRPFDKVGQIGCGRSLLPNFSEYEPGKVSPYIPAPLRKRTASLMDDTVPEKAVKPDSWLAGSNADACARGEHGKMGHVALITIQKAGCRL